MTNKHNYSFGFYRYPQKAHVLGVCAGLAERSEIDVNIVRAIAFFGIVFSGIFPGLVTYVIIGFLLPPRSRVLGADAPEPDWDDADTFGTRKSMERMTSSARKRRERREELRQERREEKAKAKADRKAAKQGGKQGGNRPATEQENQLIYASLKRRFADMEDRTRAMEKEITSSRFKLERELKTLEEA